MRTGTRRWSRAERAARATSGLRTGSGCSSRVPAGSWSEGSPSGSPSTAARCSAAAFPAAAVAALPGRRRSDRPPATARWPSRASTKPAPRCRREPSCAACHPPSVADPLVLVLRDVARADRVVPLLLVAVERRARVRRRIRLALVRALLVIHDLRALAAGGERERTACNDDHLHEGACHDLVPEAGGVGAGAGVPAGADRCGA